MVGSCQPPDGNQSPWKGKERNNKTQTGQDYLTSVCGNLNKMKRKNAKLLQKGLLKTEIKSEAKHKNTRYACRRRTKKPTGNAFKGPNLPFTYTDTNKSVKDDSLNLDGKKKK